MTYNIKLNLSSRTRYSRLILDPRIRNFFHLNEVAKRNAERPLFLNLAYIGRQTPLFVDSSYEPTAIGINLQRSDRTPHIEPTCVPHSKAVDNEHG